MTITSISREIGRKLQTQTNTTPLPGFNIAPAEDPSITSVLTQEAVEDEDMSLLVGSSLALDPAGDDISLLDNETSLIANYAYPPEDESLVYSSTTGHNSTSKLKQMTSLLTQDFNSTLNK